MILLALIVSSMIAGSLACSDDHCKDVDLANELLEVKFLPNSEKLKTLCPKVLTFLECEKEYYECPGQSLEEVATSSDKGESSRAKAMLSGMSLVRDICDEDSSLHHDYVESVDCFRDYVEPAGRMCLRDISKPIEGFFNNLYPSEDDLHEGIYAEYRCLTDALQMACVIDNLGDSCGAGAQRTAKIALERMKDFVKAKLCGDVENAADLKTRFLDFLELEDDKRNRVQGIFDLLSRRR